MLFVISSFHLLDDNRQEATPDMTATREQWQQQVGFRNAADVGMHRHSACALRLLPKRITDRAAIAGRPRRFSNSAELQCLAQFGKRQHWRSSIPWQGLQSPGTKFITSTFERDRKSACVCCGCCCGGGVKSKIDTV
jgi:hypothetical protein